MISIKNLTLLLAVLLMGLCLVSSVSAMDIDDSVSLADSDLSGASVSSNGENVAGVSSDSDISTISSNEENLAGVSGNLDEEIAGDSDSIALESRDASSSNVNSENEILSTDNTMEDSDLEHDSDYKSSKNVLSASSQPVLTASKVQTTLKGSSSTLTQGSNYVLTLTDGSGKVIAGQKLSYTIDGKTYTLTTDSKGSTYLQINLKEGKYAMKCSFAGSDSYVASSFSITLTVLKKQDSFTLKDIEAAATRVKNYVSKNRKLPNTVTVGSKKIKISEFSYLAAKAISNINSNNYNSIALINGISKGKSSSASLRATIYKAQYLTAAKYVVSNTQSKKTTPVRVNVRNQANKVVGKANFSVYTFAFAKILDFHKSDRYLPNYCTFNSSAFKKASAKKVTILKGSPSTIRKGRNYVLTLTDRNGNPIKGQKLRYKIDGKTYTLTTDSKGSTYLKINLKAGKYPMVCSFAGSKVYKSSKKSLTLTVKASRGFTISQIENAATNVKNYVAKNKKLPATVKVGSKTLKISEFSYLASKAVANLNSNKRGSIALLKGISDGSSSKHSIKSTVNKAQYVALAKSSSSNIASKKVPASSLAVKDSSNKQVNANFKVYTYAFAKILDFEKSNKYLPNYCTFESSAFGAAKKSTAITASSSSINNGEDYSVKLTDKKGNALANQKITFTISGKSYDDTTDSNGVASIKINLNDGQYPIVTSFGGSSKYKTSKLSNTLTIKNDNSFSINEIEAAAVNVKAYVGSYKDLPKTVTVANKKLSISQFSYLMAKAVYNINEGNFNDIALPNAMSGCNSSGDNLKTTVYKAEYINLTKRVVSFEESEKVPPVYAMVYSGSGSLIGKSEFKLYTFAFSKILVFHQNNKYLPNYCTFESSAFQGSAVPAGISTKIKYNANQFKNGLNEKNTETNLTKYLIGTGRSAITESIKTLANKLTKGLTSNEAKALAIYKYVRDEIGYSYYADSRYGAAGTLSAGSGNCVDQASLVVALCRASGVHARYAHAQGCTFSSGLVTGHVWAQVLVNGVWYSADATSVRNNLGNIANWNTNSYYSLKKYTAVPF